MKGLILEKFYCNSLLTTFFAILLIATSIFSTNFNLASILIFNYIWFTNILLSNSLAKQNLLSWDIFAISTPVTKSNIHSSNYFLFLIFLIIVSTLSFVLKILFTISSGSLNLLNIFLIQSQAVAFSLITISIILAINTIFGSSATQLLSTSILLITLFLNSREKYRNKLFSVLKLNYFWSLPLLAISVLIYYFSYRISLHFYIKKDFSS